ncbi:MarR family winged helix-turn-helix transcriptional regulator [Streptomyces dubilierae]|uniref:MarR family transcriptional regulator n=1 Tax=Streptomyces dubilierae TaxID=3075533 RepID=A0ABU2P1J8_9ACTN|nr:MarR family transcriptional regulator [Streptomyces sp. DSM 41921]MDT0386004.1 MarR family transcriptional regulator [Streptomyces sp. DSM 41921]
MAIGALDESMALAGAAAPSAGWSYVARFCSLVKARTGRQLRASCGLALSEYTALALIERAEEEGGRPLGVQEIAGGAGLSQSAASRLVARLEARGLLVRLTCHGDLRRAHLGLRSAGRELLESARHVHDAALRDAMAFAARHSEFRQLVQRITAEMSPAPVPNHVTEGGRRQTS